MKIKKRSGKFRFKKLHAAILVCALSIGVLQYVILSSQNRNGNGNGEPPPPLEFVAKYLFQMSASSTSSYGFYTPVTFIFQQNDAKPDVWFSYDNSFWSQLPQFGSDDFFNNINAVRFADMKVYASVAFAGNSMVYLGFTKDVSYTQVAKYYDNRVAAVTSSHDDYGSEASLTSWNQAIDLFQKYKLWFGAGVVTGWTTALSWSNLRQQIAEGYVEVQSHSRTHPYTPYSDPDSEILGSKQDILQNLPEVKYVHVWIQPYGSGDSIQHSKCGEHKYLYDRNTWTNNDGYATWQPTNNIFAAYGYSLRMGNEAAGVKDTYTLNAKFDSVRSQGGIYHIMTHPWTNWAVESYADQHLSYISQRKDIWYAGLGMIYEYRFVFLFVQYSRV